MRGRGQIPQPNTNMHINTLQQLGLSKNEADVYTALLEIGESGVGKISDASKVHQRNVYDVLNRLLEKGLVFIVLSGRENHYQAVHPNKLKELIQEEKSALNSIMPDLQKIMKSTSKNKEVMIYRGLAGWKRYIRDIIRVGQDVYCIGAKAAWGDERLKSTLELFKQAVQKRGIKSYVLYDYATKIHEPEFIKNFCSAKYAFLPKNYPTNSAIEIFGDYVVILSNMDIGKVDDNSLFTIIINPQIADAFRVWFKLMWNLAEKN